MIDRPIFKLEFFFFFAPTHQQQVNYVDSFERNELDDMLNSNTRRTNVVIFSPSENLKRKILGYFRELSRAAGKRAVESAARQPPMFLRLLWGARIRETPKTKKKNNNICAVRLSSAIAFQSYFPFSILLLLFDIVGIKLPLPVVTPPPPYQRLHLPLASFCAIPQHIIDRLSCRNNLIQPGKINDEVETAVGIDITYSSVLTAWAGLSK